VRRPWTVFIAIAALAAALAMVFVRQSHHAAIAVTPAATGSVSPVFGVNMSLYDDTDELAADPGTQAMLRSWGVPLIRVPLRAGLSDATLTGALQAVLDIGATPMVILHGPKSGGLGDNQHLLSLVTRVFGDRRVYLEYGNEQDLAGVNAAAYTAGWNQVIPALKQAAPAAYQFVGPANFQADPAYAAAFAKAARPAPDYLSWHEYVCNSGNPDSYCTDHIANWASHATAVEDAVRAATGRSIPFFISEWNLDPNDEARYANASFIQPWTQTALTQLLDLVPLGLAGAMVYTATNHGNFGLIDGGKLTPQGTVFHDLLVGSTGASPSPSASGTTPASQPAPPAKGGSTGGSSGGGSSTGAGSSGSGGSRGGSSGSSGKTTSGGGSSGGGTSHGSSGGGSSGGGSSSGGSSGSGSSGGGSSSGGSTDGSSGGVKVGFEDGLDGWDEYWGYDTLTLSRTSSVHYSGGYALKVAASDGNYVAAGTGSGLSGLHGGATVTFHVYASGGSGTVRPFVMDPSSKVHWPQGERSLPGSGWFTVTFTVPSGFTVHAIGLQLHSTSGANWVALDALSWA
jgi:hypothetical protein